MLRIARDLKFVIESIIKDSVAIRAITTIIVLFLSATFIAINITLYLLKLHYILLINK